MPDGSKSDGYWGEGYVDGLLTDSLCFFPKKVFIYTVFFFPRILLRRHTEPERHAPSLQGKEKERQNKLLKC